MPDDVGGRPFQDGWEPDDDRGGADEDFASVVFDEDFVRAARVHEPTAVERLLAAAKARAEADAARARGGPPPEDDPYDPYDPDRRGARDARRDGSDEDEYAHDPYGGDNPYGPYGGALRPYRPGNRWYRPVAWLVALLMGLGMVALAFSAVYRGSSGDRDEQIPAPASSDVNLDGTPPSAAHPAPPLFATPTPH
ncbi:SCO2584 family spore wall biosynthesis protein [Streptomyces sp. SS162]|uniref:SCO2584 family spore wall biosynthesis protein n=1 Tax=Streptomyces sp. SS162 TaxID=3108484 RepID=UPI002F3E2FC5